MTALRSFIVTLLYLFVATAAQAATLYPIEGELLVSGGDGFRAVVEPANLKPGDTVIARSGARATLVYADGCKIAVDFGDLVSVLEKSPCIKKGGTNKGRSKTDWATQTSRASDGTPYWALGLGATALIGGAALALAGSGGSSDNNKAASP